MKMVVLALAMMTGLLALGEAQNAVSELPRAQAIALQEFLKQHTELSFLPLTDFSPDELQFMHKELDATLTPYYLSYDFDQDGMKDFAVVLRKSGPPLRDQGTGFPETHRYLYEVTIVIFDGMKDGTFKPVFMENETAPLVCFLHLTNEEKRRLYFGVSETDQGFAIEPTSQGKYVVAKDENVEE